MTEKSLKSRQTGICRSKRNFSALYCSEIFTGQQCIYKASNKPFLLVGPYTFSPDCRDFFFVNKKQLIRTATDKGGGAFFQFASWLFVIDDMSGTYQNRVRAPWWDELKNKNASAVQKRDQYIYTLFLEDEKKYVTFSIPANMLNCLVEGAVL